MTDLLIPVHVHLIWDDCIHLSVLNSLMARKVDPHPSVQLPGHEGGVLGLVPTDIYIDCMMCECE